jgi:hypothetical protein
MRKVELRVGRLKTRAANSLIELYVSQRRDEMYDEALTAGGRFRSVRPRRVIPCRVFADTR